MEDPEQREQLTAYEQEHDNEFQEFDLWVIDCQDKIQQAKSNNQIEDVANRNQTTRAALVRQYNALKKQVEKEIAAFMFVLPKDPELNQTMYEDMRGKQETIKQKITVELANLAEKADKLSPGSDEMTKTYKETDQTELLQILTELVAGTIAKIKPAATSTTNTSIVQPPPGAEANSASSVGM